MINLQISPQAAQFLADVLDLWLEDIECVREDTIDTAPAETVDDFLLLVEGLREQKEIAEDLRQSLREALHGTGIS